MSFENWNRFVESVKTAKAEQGTNTDRAKKIFVKSERFTPIPNRDSKESAQK